MCSENNEHNKGPIGTVLTVNPWCGTYDLNYSQPSLEMPIFNFYHICNLFNSLISNLNVLVDGCFSDSSPEMTPAF